MTKCQACGQNLPQEAAPGQKPPMVTVKIGAPDKFADTCRTLSHMTQDEKFLGILKDFPKLVARYGELTEGRWKFFAIVHEKCTGAWPKREDFQTEDPPASFSELPPEDEVPF